MSARVLVTDYAWESLDIERGILAEVGAEVVVAEPDDAAMVEQARDADAILTNWRRVPAEALDAAPRCLVVSRYGVGVDNIPVDRATELGIVVTNVPDFCLDEVSDHAMALLLACARRIVTFASSTRPASGGCSSSAAGCRGCAGRCSAWSGSATSPARSSRRPGRSASRCWPTRRGCCRARSTASSHQRPRRAARALRLRVAARPGERRDAGDDRRGRAAADEADGVPDQHLARRPDRRAGAAARGRRGLDRRRRPRRAGPGAAAGGPPARRRRRDRGHPARGVLLRGLDRRAAAQGGPQRGRGAARRGAGDGGQPGGPRLAAAAARSRARPRGPRAGPRAPPRARCAGPSVADHVQAPGRHGAGEPGRERPRLTPARLDDDVDRCEPLLEEGADRAGPDDGQAVRRRAPAARGRAAA